MPRRQKQRTHHWVWSMPALVQIKVNIDGFFLGGSGKGGIRGVFRDSAGRELL